MSKPAVQKYFGVYNDFSELLGEEAVEKIFQTMAGQQITLPKKLYTKDYVIEETKYITDRTELKRVALQYGYTERRLKQILKEGGKERP